MRLLLALFLSLMAGSASAGALYGGYCYPTVQDASYAWCNDLALAVSGGADVSTALLGSSGNLQSTTVTARGVAYGACTTFGAVSGQTQAVTRSLFAYSTGTVSTAASGTWASTSSGSGTATSSASHVTTLRFLACTDSSNMTAADGITLGWQVGGVWLAVAALLLLARVFRGVS